MLNSNITSKLMEILSLIDHLDLSTALKGTQDCSPAWFFRILFCRQECNTESISGTK